MIIGITGNIGSGKSTISKYLEKIGYEVINVDKLAHQILENNTVKNEIVKTFKKDILTNDRVDRKKLGEIVFKNKAELTKLNNIMHPKIIDEIKKIISSNKNNFLFFDIPLLFELNISYLFDVIICVYISKNLQIKRIKKRDNRNYKQIREIIKSQLSVEYKIENSTYSINNKNIKKSIRKMKKILKGLYENKEIRIF